MSNYVSQFYPQTVLCTNDLEEVKTKVEELLKKNLDKDKKFVDPDFGPNKKDPKGELAIFYPSEESVNLQGDASVGQYNNVAGLNIDMISWLRPKDFCKDPKKCAFLTEEEEEEKGRKKGKNIGGASSLDVMQGNLGDCWFISAMALVAIRDDIFQGLICNGLFKSYEQKGLYVFKMYKNCRQHYVIIDDQVPCLEKARGDYIPAFARCRNPNEFWVSLIEKAYAKLNIRYINLTSGFIDEALQDLSGLAPEMSRFSPNIDPDALWESLKLYINTGSLLGTSLNFLGRRDYQEDEKRELQREAKMSGIQYGHAYGILDVRELTHESENFRLIRLKNPWGKDNNLEWNGSWGDQDKRWTPDLKKKYNEAGLKMASKLDKDELEHKFGKNDNIFIMDVSDYVRFFNTLMIVRDFPDEWSGIRYFTQWNPGFGIPGRAKEWARNPSFAFELKKKTEISVRLQQPDQRCFADARPPMKKLVLMFMVQKGTQLPSNFLSTNVVLQSNAADSRSVSGEKELDPGQYILSIFTVNEGTVSDCYLSVYFNCKKNEIVFQDSSWEVILEEEEESEEKPKKRPKGPLKAKIQPKPERKTEETETEIEIETNDSVDSLEVVIKDPAALELEIEMNMCAILGVGYQNYKDFQDLSFARQNEIAALQWSNSGVLDLNDYCLGCRGVSVLLGVIISEKNLRVLGLAGNQINDSIIIELVNHLKTQKTLQELDVSNNAEITDRGAAALLYLAGRVRSLIKIDVSRTSVSGDLAHQIMTRLNNRIRS